MRYGGEFKGGCAPWEDPSFRSDRQPCPNGLIPARGYPLGVPSGKSTRPSRRVHLLRARCWTLREAAHGSRLSAWTLGRRTAYACLREMAIRARVWGLLAAGLILFAACGEGDDTAALEQRIEELEEELAAGPSTTTSTTAEPTTTAVTVPPSATTTLPRAYVEAVETCRATRDRLLEVQDEVLALVTERNDWNQRRSDYLDGLIADQDEVAESAKANVRADDLAVVFGRLEALEYGPTYGELVLNLMRFVDALWQEAELEAELVLLHPYTDPWSYDYWAGLIDQANVAYYEWTNLWDRVQKSSTSHAFAECADEAEPLRGQVDCVGGCTGA